MLVATLLHPHWNPSFLTLTLCSQQVPPSRTTEAQKPTHPTTSVEGNSYCNSRVDCHQSKMQNSQPGPHKRVFESASPSLPPLLCPPLLSLQVPAPHSALGVAALSHFSARTGSSGLHWPLLGAFRWHVDMVFQLPSHPSLLPACPDLVLALERTWCTSFSSTHISVPGSCSPELWDPLSPILQLQMAGALRGWGGEGVSREEMARTPHPSSHT